ncbi:MAG TPA: hypothetical protein VEG34_13625 [Thermoanaerobaculia bacterium]|nr:hypothetical protein [Thermoanaerobaculia bacterium]
MNVGKTLFAHLYGRLERFIKRSVSPDEWARAPEEAWDSAVEDFDR